MRLPGASAQTLHYAETGILRVGVARTRNIDCPVCRGRARWRLAQDWHRRLDFHLCRSCGLLFTAADISEDELGTAYDELDTPSHYEAVATQSRAKASRAIADLSSLLTGSATVVDVGCGGGHMLAAMTSDTQWNGVGFDRDPKSVALCSAAGMVATTDDAHLPQADAVTMLDVAEHVRDVHALFRQAYDVLAPSGVLYVHTPRRCLWDTTALGMLALPGARSVAEKWLRTRVSVFHLRLWSEAALTCALNDAGFTVLSFRREMELSWPVGMYVELYVGEKFGAPPAVVKMAHRAAGIVARFRLVRNKAIVTARRTG